MGLTEEGGPWAPLVGLGCWREPTPCERCYGPGTQRGHWPWRLLSGQGGASSEMTEGPGLSKQAGSWMAPLMWPLLAQKPGIAVKELPTRVALCGNPNCRDGEAKVGGASDSRERPGSRGAAENAPGGSVVPAVDPVVPAVWLTTHTVQRPKKTSALHTTGDAQGRGFLCREVSVMSTSFSSDFTKLSLPVS